MRRNDRRAVVAAKHAMPPPDQDDWTCHVCGRPLDEMCEACDDEVERLIDGLDGETTQERRTQG